MTAVSRRLAALKRFCPTCGTFPGSQCIGARGKPRTAIHADRYVLAAGGKPA
ncbi:zinc finger domain-containing protein [Sphingomonas beigongshangi]|uniref:zinc finger domain-containing protein n=1 Tax=Sphingomonas beigongshangi TaxID=2782540 RepID=UPI003B849427